MVFSEDMWYARYSKLVTFACVPARLLSGVPPRPWLRTVLEGLAIVNARIGIA